MARISVEVSESDSEALQSCADGHRTPVSGLLEDYIAYLLSGGQPVRPPADTGLSTQALTSLAQWGGALDWLADEPDIYSLDDGEPV